MFKEIMSYIFSFIVVILICIIVIMTFVQCRVLNENYIQEKLEKSNYYEKLEATINDGFENYIMQSGMDNSVFEGIYDSNKLKKDTKNIIDAMLNNKDIYIENDDIKEKLDINIKKYIADNKLSMNKTVESQIEDFKNVIISTYNKNVFSSLSIIETAKNIVVKVKKIVPIVTIVSVILLLLNIALIIGINFKNKKVLLKYCAVIMFSIAGLSLICVILEKSFLGIQDLTVINENLSMIIQIFVKEIYKILYIACIIGGLLGIGFSATSCWQKKVIEKRH